MEVFDLFRRFRKEVKGPEPQARQDARAALADAIENESGRQGVSAKDRSRRSWKVRLIAVGAGAAVIAALVVSIDTWTDREPGGAEIIKRAYASVSEKGGILHMVMMSDFGDVFGETAMGEITEDLKSEESGLSKEEMEELDEEIEEEMEEADEEIEEMLDLSEVRYEIWSTVEDSVRVHSIMVDKSGRILEEKEVSEDKSLLYDGDSNKITVSKGSRAPTELKKEFTFDPVEEYRELYKSGKVRYEGEVDYKGTSAYKLVVGAAEGIFPNSGRSTYTYIVGRHNYYPLEMKVTNAKGELVLTVHIKKFEYLPFTEENEKLLKMRPHPNAKVVSQRSEKAKAKSDEAKAKEAEKDFEKFERELEREDRER